MSDDRFTPEQQAIEQAALEQAAAAPPPPKPVPVHKAPPLLPCRRYVDNPVTADEIEAFRKRFAERFK